MTLQQYYEKYCGGDEFTLIRDPLPPIRVAMLGNFGRTTPLWVGVLVWAWKR